MQVRSALEVQKMGNEGYEADWIAIMPAKITALESSFRVFRAYARRCKSGRTFLHRPGNIQVAQRPGKDGLHFCILEGECSRKIDGNISECVFSG
jgi:hypothetical protein